MKNNSQLAGLFNLPGNYGSAQAGGLQTATGNTLSGQIAAELGVRPPSATCNSRV